MNIRDRIEARRLKSIEIFSLKMQKIEKNAQALLSKYLLMHIGETDDDSSIMAIKSVVEPVCELMSSNLDKFAHDIKVHDISVGTILRFGLELKSSVKSYCSEYHIQRQDDVARKAGAIVIEWMCLNIKEIGIACINEFANELRK